MQLPKLGWFQQNASAIPYDYADVLSLLAPRSTLLFTPQQDRGAVYSDVNATIALVSSLWPAGQLTHVAPPTGVNEFVSAQILLLHKWLAGVVGHP